VPKERLASRRTFSRPSSSFSQEAEKVRKSYFTKHISAKTCAEMNKNMYLCTQVLPKAP
jgi:hypothetical protein